VPLPWRRAQQRLWSIQAFGLSLYCPGAGRDTVLGISCPHRDRDAWRMRGDVLPAALWGSTAGTRACGARREYDKNNARLVDSVPGVHKLLSRVSNNPIPQLCAINILHTAPALALLVPCAYPNRSRNVSETQRSRRRSSERHGPGTALASAGKGIPQPSPLTMCLHRACPAHAS
jgi:hypothetical protein